MRRAGEISRQPKRTAPRDRAGHDRHGSLPVHHRPNCWPNMTANDNKPKLSLLDRSVPLVLDSKTADDETPSRRLHAIDASTERCHRLQGTSLISSAWRLLLGETHPASTLCYATSALLFHRFYAIAGSLATDNAWSVAMAAVLLTSKLEEQVSVSIQQIILVFAHLYRRRALLVTPSSIDREAIRQHAMVATLNVPQDRRAQLLRPTSLSPVGPVYQEWYKTLVAAENQILRRLGFCLYWIPDHVAHKFLDDLIQLLKLSADNEHDLKQRAWNYCNDAYRLDLPTRFAPQVMACAAIHLAWLDVTTARTHNSIPSPPPTAQSPMWWTLACGKDAASDVAEAANAILGLYDEQNLNVQAALYGFLPSLEPDGSFNDPDSFLWEQLADEV